MGMSVRGGARGGRRRRRGSGNAPMSEINVTPFVDVMLVLLVIFMVAAPMLTSGVPLELPSASGTTQLEAAKSDPLIVSVARDGKLYLGEEDSEALTLDQLTEKLRVIRQARIKSTGEAINDVPVFVRGDTTVNYGAVARTMAGIRDAGFSKLSLVTQTDGGG